MQIQIFTIPLIDNSVYLKEMNSFIATNKIIEIQQELVSNRGEMY